MIIFLENTIYFTKQLTNINEFKNYINIETMELFDLYNVACFDFGQYQHFVGTFGNHFIKSFNLFRANLFNSYYQIRI